MMRVSCHRIAPYPVRPPNDCRISCNAASHATETAARFVRRLENGLAESATPRSADCDSRPLGRRANKRRVVSFLQRLGGPWRLTMPGDIAEISWPACMFTFCFACDVAAG